MDSQGNAIASCSGQSCDILNTVVPGQHGAGVPAIPGQHGAGVPTVPGQHGTSVVTGQPGTGVVSGQHGTGVVPGQPGTSGSGEVEVVEVTEESQSQPDVNPWPYLNNYFEFKGKSGKSLDYLCILCKPRTKILKASISTQSNLKSHIERKHPQQLKKFEEASALGSRRGKNRKELTAELIDIKIIIVKRTFKIFTGRCSVKKSVAVPVYNLVSRFCFLVIPLIQKSPNIFKRDVNNNL
jgi:hypothetical protein